MNAHQEEKCIINAFNCGVISKEESDKLLDDITPLLYELLYKEELVS